jgi:hypothetical protein
MRWTTTTLLLLAFAGCSLPTGVSFRCESDGGCPEGLRCVALEAGRYCLGTPGCGPALDPDDTLFVHADGGNDMNSGVSGTAAFATITRALSRSVVLRRSVIALAPGTYSEPVSLVATHAGRTITGGFLTDWSADCSSDARDRTVLEGPEGVGIAMTNVSGPEVTLSRLTVRSGPSPKASGSTYGVLALSSNIALNDVVVIAESANAGSTPFPPPEGIDATSCLGISDCSDGGTGAKGATGPPSDAGWFNQAGYVAGVGEPGGSGAPGFHGTLPPQPVPDTCAACNGSTPCNNGNLACGTTTSIRSGSRGRCGCGGVGGQGGAGGTGGGASIALFASGGSVVRVTNSNLRSTTGGAGAGGAVGGLGSPGSSGARGSSFTCINPNRANCGRTVCSATCEPSGPPLSIPGGASGGMGGSGGVGGAGGPGAGGPSVGVVSVSSRVTLTSTSVNTGAGGQEAQGGRAGFSQPSLMIP